MEQEMEQDAECSDANEPPVLDHVKQAALSHKGEIDVFQDY
jgi:hypothetical protein